MGLMIGLIAPFCSGLLFGIGLLVSGMTNPAKVQNFLDITGTWDPSLAFVMIGALSVAIPGFWLVRRRTQPVVDQKFHLSPIGRIDRNLIAGATMFGTGWGLAGLCPGPAITSTFTGSPEIHVFLPAMLMGVSTAVLLLATGIPRAKIKAASSE